MGFNTFYKIFFVLSLISIPLYVLFLSTIIRFRKVEPFNGSFFTICLSLGVIDLISVMNCWLLYRSCLFGWLGLADYAKAYDLHDRFLPKLFIMMTWFCALNQSLCMLANAFNRLTAIVFSHKHNMIWTPQRTCLIIALIWIISVFLTAPLGTRPFEYVIDNKTGDVHGNNWMDHGMEIFYYRTCCVYFMILNVICLAIYLSIAIKVKMHKNQITKNKSRSLQTTVSTADIKLAIYGFCMFTIMFACSMFQLYMTSGPENQDHYDAIMIWNGINDVYSWSNPWFILAFSEPSRDYMFKMVKCASGNENQVQSQKAGNIVKVTQQQENDKVVEVPPGEIEMASAGGK